MGIGGVGFDRVVAGCVGFEIVVGLLMAIVDVGGC